MFWVVTENVTVPGTPAVFVPVCVPTDTDFCATGGAVTVTAHVADLLPLREVAVMVAVPAFTAVTLPVASTVATPSALDFHDTSLMVAFGGATVAVSLSLAPSTSVKLVLLSDTPLTPTSFVFLQDATMAAAKMSAATENKYRYLFILLLLLIIKFLLIFGTRMTRIARIFALKGHHQ
jgi:hypothetical protein